MSTPTPSATLALHPFEAAGFQIRGNLLRWTRPEPVTNNTPFVEGLYLSWDPQAGPNTLDAAPKSGSLCEIKTQITTTPSWTTLNITLGTSTLRAGDSLGVVLDLRASQPATITGFLRTAAQGMERDTELGGQINIGPQSGVQMIQHRFDSYEEAVQGEGYHTLILRLPAINLSLDLRDLRILLRPGQGQGGARKAAATLSTAV